MKTLKQVISINPDCVSPSLMVSHEGRMITTQHEYPKEAWQKYDVNKDLGDLKSCLLAIFLKRGAFYSLPLVVYKYERTVAAC